MVNPLRVSKRPGCLWNAGPRLLSGFHGSAHALLGFSQFRGELGAEILRLEDLANLDVGFDARERVGCTLDPVDRLLPGLHLENPEAGNELIGLGEGTVDHRALVAPQRTSRACLSRL